jgi:hypothetical protein
MKGATIMVRQCAWCLRLINSLGEWTSSRPVAKIYEASHGICQVCCEHSMAEALEQEDDQKLVVPVSAQVEVTCFC